MGFKEVGDWLLEKDAQAQNALRYYLGPAYAPVNALAQFGAMMSPGADMMDMAQSSDALMNSPTWKDAGLNALGLGAATLGAFIPGTARGIEEAVDTAADATRKGIRAYHGSPHDFDKFSLEHIGKGEGAQAYGHGLYFAENEAVARDYREQLARGGRGHVAAYRAAGQDVPVSDKQAADIAYMMRTYNIDTATPDGEEWLASEIGARGLPSSIRDKIDQFLQAGVEREDMAGRMYEVNIKANPEDFLDWDKPLSEQSERVREWALDNLKTKGWQGDNVPLRDVVQQWEESGLDPWDATRGMPELKQRGQDLYFSAVNDARGMSIAAGDNASTALKPSQGAASNELYQGAGIPGIKYLDQGSRAAGEGTQNYVVFDDSLISILRKYGLLGMIGGGAGAAAMSEDYGGGA